MSFASSVTQPAPACSEHELVAAVRRGDNRAFEELYSRYRSRISSYVFGMVGDYARAEDIAQEVFISALRRLRDTERPIAFKPWIYEIAKNACIDEFRRARRGREVPLVANDASTSDERELPSSAPTPDAAVESKQSLVDLRGAFHGLSDNHHKIIVMRELEGLSYSQIGERLGMSRPVVESTLFRARRRLSEEYDELASGRRCQHVQTVIDTGDERAFRKLGIRERRQVAKHLSHCQPCRRHARMAGVDDSAFQAPSVIGKIAALLPIPWLRWRRGAGDEDSPASSYGAHSLAALRSLPTIARLADPAAPSVGAGRAAAVVAALALAGVGGGVVAVTTTNHHGGQPGGVAPPRAHGTRPSSHRAGPVAPASLRSGSQRPTTAGNRSVGRPRGPAASAHGSTSAPTRASTATSSTASGTSRGVNHVLSGATSAATGGATHLAGIHLPRVPAIPAPTLPTVPKVVKIPKVVKVPNLGTPSIPKLKLPNPLKPVSSPPKLASQPPQLPHLSAPQLPPVALPPLPKVPNPVKQLLSP